MFADHTNWNLDTYRLSKPSPGIVRLEGRCLTLAPPTLPESLPHAPSGFFHRPTGVVHLFRMRGYGVVGSLLARPGAALLPCLPALPALLVVGLVPALLPCLALVFDVVRVVHAGVLVIVQVVNI